MKSIERLAIANRGEVAVRIIRACQDMGIESILLHSEADTNSIAYRMADHRICIGPPSISESYLNIENTVYGALSTEADAIHPGFGFLSENADFSRACVKNQLIFIGPSSESLCLFGDKISAKQLVEKAGALVVPGYSGEDQSLEKLKIEAEIIGYPVIVKTAGGGGGRGLKVIENANEAQEAIESARREGLSAFGSDRVFLEKYLGHAKHIEVQIFGEVDGRIYHLLDRECSVQRRHQKLIEEAVSPSLDFDLRQKISETAVNIAKEAKYLGAGTVEFLLQDGQFYFLEMNTRLQVEHPVTELVLGVDLVQAQILAAQCKSLMWNQDELYARGHAIECRIYTEDPYRDGMPSTGVLGGCHWPQGPGRRFDVGFEPGDEVTAYYDSMIAKIIVWDETRSRALRKMRRTLEDTVIFGLKTNIPHLQQILSHPEFVSGEMTTRFIAQNFPNGLEGGELSESEKEIAQLVAQKMANTSPTNPFDNSPNPWMNSWGNL